MKIVADKDIPFIEEYFKSQGELVLLSGRDFSSRQVKDADMVMVRSITPVNADLLAGSTVKFVGTVTSGVDHLDLTWLKQLGIHVASAHGFNAQPVADYVVSIIAAAQRRQALSIQRKKAVIIGVGEVGSRVMQHLTALGFTVQLCDPIRAHQEVGFFSTPLNDIHDVDLICLHTPLTQDGSYPTYHMIDEAFLARQAEGCMLINAGRGEVIKTEALKTQGKHLFWCLDVFENEPTIDPDVVRGALFATPHIAGYSVQAKIRGIARIYEQAKALGFVSANKELQDHAMPTQVLSFAGQHQHWQDIVMGIFNPLVMTAMMREAFLVPTPARDRFDAMRRAFNYRHEFAYTTVSSDSLLVEDITMLKALGIACQ